MNQRRIFLTALAALWLAAAGCSSQPSPPSPEASQPLVDGKLYLMSVEPTGGVGVAEMREQAEDGQAVTVIGRIGGSKTPWVEGLAAFTIVDPALKACSDIEGDECPTPWDYCCETEALKTSMTLVKVVDKNGTVIAANARELLGLKELDTVVVQGKSACDEAGNVTILTSGVFVRPQGS